MPPPPSHAYVSRRATRFAAAASLPPADTPCRRTPATAPLIRDATLTTPRSFFRRIFADTAMPTLTALSISSPFSLFTFSSTLISPRRFFQPFSLFDFMPFLFSSFFTLLQLYFSFFFAISSFHTYFMTPARFSSFSPVFVLLPPRCITPLFRRFFD
jgi:hypothetical protein